jgi:hypothetical protein
MARRVLVATTTRGAMRALAHQGSAVHAHHQQIARLLEQRLGPAHARLFAEPLADPARDTVDWYAAVDGTPKPLSALPADRAATARLQLDRLTAEIVALAASLAGDPQPHRRNIARILDLALQHPGDGSIHVVEGEGHDDQVVLAGWGFAPADADAAAAPVSRLAPDRPMPPAAAAGVPAAVAPTIVVPVAAASGPSWIAWLLWFLLGILIALGLLGGQRLYAQWIEARSADPGAAQLAESRAREVALREELGRLRREAAVKRRQCVVDQKASEFDKRLGAAGGKTGEITITLIWSSEADLDLHARCPSGEIVGITAKAGCGGELDVDANVKDPTTSPVENIRWLAGKAPAGKFQVYVRNYDPRGDGDKGTSFKLRVTVKDKTEYVDGTVTKAEGAKPVTTFTVEADPRATAPSGNPPAASPPSAAPPAIPVPPAAAPPR